MIERQRQITIADGAAWVDAEYDVDASTREDVRTLLAYIVGGDGESEFAARRSDRTAVTERVRDARVSEERIEVSAVDREGLTVSLSYEMAERSRDRDDTPDRDRTRDPREGLRGR